MTLQKNSVQAQISEDVQLLFTATTWSDLRVLFLVYNLPYGLVQKNQLHKYRAESQMFPNFLAMTYFLTFVNMCNQMSSKVNNKGKLWSLPSNPKIVTSKATGRNRLF